MLTHHPLRNQIKAGFFMVAPKPGDMERAKEIIFRRELDAYKKGVNFDRVYGWGHKFEEPDLWQRRFGQKAAKWAWFGAQMDQGFGYYWPKYEKKNVTILLYQKAENWGSSENGTVVLQEVIQSPFDRYMNPLIPNDRQSCLEFLCDHHHFGGPLNKPWITGPPADMDIYNESSRIKSPLHLWFYTLMALDRELSMGVNFTHWEKGSHKALDGRILGSLARRSKDAAMRAGLPVA